MEHREVAMSALLVMPSPEMGLDLVRDAIDTRRLPRWDPRYWGHVVLKDDPRCAECFRALGLSWAKARAHARATGSFATEIERLPHEPKRELQLAYHQLSLEPQHAIPGATERAVPPRISATSAGVIRAIDLNHQPDSWRTEINDEATDHDLPLEADAELVAANGLPQPLFGWRERSAHGRSASPEQLSPSDSKIAFFQGNLLVPAKWPGVAPHGAGSVTRD